MQNKTSCVLTKYQMHKVSAQLLERCLYAAMMVKLSASEIMLVEKSQTKSDLNSLSHV